MKSPLTRRYHKDNQMVYIICVDDGFDKLSGVNLL
jgi:hypothetical protein